MAAVVEIVRGRQANWCVSRNSVFILLLPHHRAHLRNTFHDERESHGLNARQHVTGTVAVSGDVTLSRFSPEAVLFYAPSPPPHPLGEKKLKGRLYTRGSKT